MHAKELSAQLALLPESLKMATNGGTIPAMMVSGGLVIGTGNGRPAVGGTDTKFELHAF